MNFDHLIDTQLWAVIHTHRHGMDLSLVTAHTEPTEEDVVKVCGIDFEPHRNEYIDIFRIDLKEENIPHIET